MQKMAQHAMMRAFPAIESCLRKSPKAYQSVRVKGLCSGEQRRFRHDNHTGQRCKGHNDRNDPTSFTQKKVSHDRY